MLLDIDVDVDKLHKIELGVNEAMAIMGLQRGSVHKRFDSIRSDSESLPEPDLDTELSKSDGDTISSAPKLDSSIRIQFANSDLKEEVPIHDSKSIKKLEKSIQNANCEENEDNYDTQLNKADLSTNLKPLEAIVQISTMPIDLPQEPETVTGPPSDFLNDDDKKSEAQKAYVRDFVEHIETDGDGEGEVKGPSGTREDETSSSLPAARELSNSNRLNASSGSIGLIHTDQEPVFPEENVITQQNYELDQSVTHDSSIPEAFTGPVNEAVPEANEPSQQRQPYKESNAGDGTTTFEQQVHGARLVATLVSCVSALFITALDQTIISTLLTEVGDKFGAFQKIGWLSLGYLLPMATLAPSYGKVSIAFGRKNLILFGIIIFEIGSLVCALANSMDMLIAGRVIQGIGGGAIQAMVVVILTELVPMTKRALSFVLLGLTFSIASVLGPFVGGAFTTKVTWRWCFYINIPVGAIAFALLWVGFRPPPPVGDLREKLRKIDYIGTSLLTTGLVLFLLGLTFGGVDFPWKSAAVISCFCIGGVGLFCFCVWNFKYSSNPIIIKEIVMTPQVFAASMAAMFNFGFFMANLIYLAVYFQVIFNASAWRSGIDLLPLIVLVSLTSMLNGAFLKFTRNVKLTMLILGFLGPLGCGLLLLLTKSLPVRNRIGFLIVIGISVGLQFQSSVLAAQLRTPSNIEGSIIFTTIFLNFAKCVGGAISISLAQLIFLSSGSHYVVELLRSLDENSPEYAELIEVVPKALISSPRLIRGLSPGARDMVLDEFMRALKNVFYMSLSFACTSCVFSIFTTNRKIPTELEMELPEDRATDAELREAIIANNDASSIAPPLNESEWMALTRTTTRKSQC